jgi:spermidine/putrescine transport system permease protein
MTLSARASFRPTIKTRTAKPQERVASVREAALVRRRRRLLIPGATPSSANVLLTLPLTLLLLALVGVPAAVFLLYSFWQVESFSIVHDFTTENYRLVFADASYRPIFVNSLTVGALTAIACCLFGFALAWAVRFHAGRARNVLVVAIVVASVGSYLARLYAWRSILGAEGVVNYTLDKLGVIDDPLGFLIFNRFAVIVTLTNVFLPFAFLPIYANLLSIRPEVLEAGRVLGAGPIANFRRVILPLSLTGLTISFAYVLIFATGDFAASAFLGGPTGVVTARVIADQFGIAFNWPLGAALAFVYVFALAAIVGALAVYAARRAKRIGS